LLATTNHINAKNQKIVDAYNDVKAIFSRTKSARLYVVSPSGNVAKTSVGSEYSVNPAQTKEMLDSYTEGVSDYYTYLDSAYHSTLNLPLRENAAKYTALILMKKTHIVLTLHISCLTCLVRHRLIPVSFAHTQK